jgi:hypothetical protein
MQTVPLYVVASVNLNGSGNGTASAGPQTPGESWVPANVGVSCATNVLEATAALIVNSVQVDATFTGSSGDSSDSASSITVYPGQFVSVTWTGGDAGTRATAVISGTRTVA